MSEFDTWFEGVSQESPSDDVSGAQTGPEQQERLDPQMLQREWLSEHGAGNPPVVSDAVTPQRLWVYVQGARGETGIELSLDKTGEQTGRPTPPEGFAWLIVAATDEQTFQTYEDLITPHLLEVIEHETPGPDSTPQYPPHIPRVDYID